MRESLIHRPSLSKAETRALLVRHTVYSCILVVCVTIAARVMSRWHQPRRAADTVDLQGIAKTIAVCRSELERFERQRDWLRQASVSRVRPLRMLMNLGSALPDDVWITAVTVEGTDVTVMGASTTEVALSVFLELLASQGAIERIRLDTSRENVGTQQGMREFSISGTIVAPARDEEDIREPDL